MLLFFSLLGFTSIEPGGTPEPPVTPTVFSHELLESVQSSYVDELGRVDYASLAINRTDLERYYQLLASCTGSTPTTERY